MNFLNRCDLTYLSIDRCDLTFFFQYIDGIRLFFNRLMWYGFFQYTLYGIFFNKYISDEFFTLMWSEFFQYVNVIWIFSIDKCNVDFFQMERCNMDFF